MNVHEYQAKGLLARYGVQLPEGGVAATPEEAERVAEGIGAAFWVVKAQIHAGNRGQSGGVKIARSAAEVR
ncbi:MAG: succinate--CoA ligase subunit beta, partial [Gammaproteobacteria bacterium]|nr:succinate--CoA ligase subunit beta [Gammaproteobacteria bacterium]